MVLAGVIGGVVLMLAAVGGMVAVVGVRGRAHLLRPRRRVLGVSAAVVFLLGAALATRSLLAEHWTNMTPRFALAALLDIAEPYPERPDRFAPTPDFARSGDRWERLRWQQQYAHAARAWYERVQATPTDRLATLVPDAQRMQALTGERAGTLWNDAWPGRAAERRLRARAARDDAGAALPTATWAITELQGLRTGTPEARSGFIAPPMAVLGHIADSGGPDAGLYAVERASSIKNAQARALLERLARGEDPSVRAAAARALDWRADFAPPSTWTAAGPDDAG
jgi:hypothetical protein